MTNAIAFTLLALIAAFFALDHFVLHQGYALQLARAFIEFVEWVSFWR